MQEHYSLEEPFETDLVNLLTTRKGWKDGVLDRPTEDELVGNWAEILFRNNNTPERLNGAPLTSSEMAQLMAKVRAADTPSKANEFINGRSVAIRRDNPDDPVHIGSDVYLTLFSRDDVAGGTCTYQIARQPVFKSRSSMYSDRRGDVMLLINGMPVIHIELKRSGVPWTDALHQLEKYTYEHVFEGMFSLVQVFVCMTPEETRYFANPGRAGLDSHGSFNRKFVFSWGDESNAEVRRWDQIAEELLSIPMAHKMVAFYTIADSGDGILKVLRSYQYRAVSAIERRLIEARGLWGLRRPDGGYVWHTTGSGKTMTSFKAAQLAARSRLVDKVVFLVDRIELGTQSLGEYRAFADPMDTVNDTEDSGVLLGLLDPTGAGRDGGYSRALIVTSINKMQIVAKARASHERLARINSQRIVFIVDECHRSTFGEMMADIKRAFPMAMLIGFTGTPITSVNSHGTSTTLDVFGGEIARYTLADGIRDGNVLGFQLGKVETFSSDDLRRSVALERARSKTEEEALRDTARRKVFLEYMDPARHPMATTVTDDGRRLTGIEDFVPEAQYDSDRHRRAVVRDIRSKLTTLTQGRRLHSMLTCPSISEAYAYYLLLREEMPDLRVTCLFDASVDNREGNVAKESMLERILTDYNAMYGTSFTVPTHALFKVDLAARLAHKRPYEGIEGTPDRCLDMLVVVNQMLTGYDSKWLGVLFIDRVLEYEGVIQAFSRTNRVLDAEKTCGVIRYYRKVHTMDRNVTRAVELYSGGMPVGLIVSSICDNVRQVNEALSSIRSVFHAAGIDDLSRLPDNDDAVAMFCKEYNVMGRALRAARVQGFTFEETHYECDDFLTGEHLSADCELDEGTHNVLTLRYLEVRRETAGPGSRAVGFDIDPSLATLDTKTIDRDYVNRFFQVAVRAISDGSDEQAVRAALDELHSAYPNLSREDQEAVDRAISMIRAGTLAVNEGWECNDYVNHIRALDYGKQVDAAAERFGVDAGRLRELVALHPAADAINDHGRFDELMATTDKAKARAALSSISGHPVKGKDVMRTVDAVLREFILEGGCNVTESVMRELSD